VPPVGEIYEKAAEPPKDRPVGAEGYQLALGCLVDQQQCNPGSDCADHQHSQQGEKRVGILALNPRIVPTLVH
jgi:hypothetical protein